MAPSPTAAALIERAIRKAQRSHRWLSTETGIALSTLNRKLNGHGDFYLHEIASIARALSIRPCTLLPEAFREDAGLADSPRRILAGIAA